MNMLNWKSKKNVRYTLDWKVDLSNGDCFARVTRTVFYGLVPNPAEETKFQAHVTKTTLRMYPWPGQTVFKMPVTGEYEKLVTILKAFYSGTNKSKDFYYWELPEEDITFDPKQVATIAVSDPVAKPKKKKGRVPRKKGPDEIWQKTT